jgi:hypothetical protein
MATGLIEVVALGWQTEGLGHSLEANKEVREYCNEPEV